LQQGKIHPYIRAETIKIIRIAIGTHILLALSTSLVLAQASTNNGGGLSASPPPSSCAAFGRFSGWEIPDQHGIRWA